MRASPRRSESAFRPGAEERRGGHASPPDIEYGALQALSRHGRSQDVDSPPAPRETAVETRTGSFRGEILRAPSARRNGQPAGRLARALEPDEEDPAPSSRCLTLYPIPGIADHFMQRRQN